MNKKEFYKIQSDAFKDYLSKFSDKENLLSLFNKWVISKNIYGVDRHEIWLIVRKLKPAKSFVIKKGTDADFRFTNFLDYIHKIDLANLKDTLDRRERKTNKVDKT